MKPAPFVAVIVATYRRPVELRRLIASLDQPGTTVGAIVIADNAADQALESELAGIPRVHWLPLPENAGCGAGLRSGAEWALEKFGDRLTHLWYLDDDVVLPPNAEKGLLDALAEADADLASPFAVGRFGTIDFYPGLLDAEKHRGIRTVRKPAEFVARWGDASVPVGWATGTCILVTRRAVEAVGLHRRDYWIRGEDLEFSLRVTARFAGIFVPRVVIEHLPPVSSPGPHTTQGEFRRHCALVQNTTFTSTHLPHARALLRSLPGTYRHFFRDWGLSPWSISVALRLFCRGCVLGQPAGESAPYRAPDEERWSIPSHIPTFNVLGVAVSAMDLPTAAGAILAAARAKSKGYICVTGVHGITEAQNDEGFRKILNGAFLNTTDGMPLVWIGRSLAGPYVSRVYGPDLMEEMCKATQQLPFRHFLYGGAPGVAEELKANLEARFPGVQIVGTYTPPFRPLNPEEERQLAGIVSAAKPDLMWIGLSTPKQERFMAEYLPKLETTLMAGVGAAFDFHSGRVRQAPRWVQRSGLEWLFRLLCEPRRLARRYLVNNPLFVGRLILQALGLRKYPLE